MYVIAKTCYSYDPKGRSTLLEDDISGRTLRFATLPEARAYISELENNAQAYIEMLKKNGTCYIAACEYEVPTYRARHIDDLPEHLAEMVF